MTARDWLHTLPMFKDRPDWSARLDLLMKHAGSYLLALAIVLSVAAQLRQFASNRPPHWDERALRYNIIHRSGRQLLQPLDFDQAAPVLYLLSTRAIGRATGFSFQMLRVPSLIASLFTLGVLAWIARRLMSDTWAAFAVALYGLATYTVFYAADYKPYSIDALAAVGSLALMDWFFRGRRTRISLIGMVFYHAFIPWISYAAVFVSAAFMLALALDSTSHRRWRGPVAAAIGTGISIAANLILTTLGATRNHSLTNFWREAFWPLWPPRIRTFTFPFYYLLWFFRLVVGLESGTCGAALSAVGAADLWSRHRSLCVAFIAPLGLALIASGLHVYPFAERLLMFASPPAVLLIVLGLQRLYSIRDGAARGLAMVLVAWLLFVLFFLATKRVMNPTHIPSLTVPM